MVPAEFKNAAYELQMINPRQGPDGPESRRRLPLELQSKLVMKNRLSLKALLLTWIALAVVVSNGCRQNAATDSRTDTGPNRAHQIARGIESAQGPVGPNPGTAPRSLPTQAQGTGDLGGGNGLNGKLFESYIIDPTTTKAWLDHIKPVADHLKALSIQNEESEDGRKHLNDQPDMLTASARLLKWYVAPVDLNTIDKKTLGVDFFKDPVQQLALQTPNEVWINKAMFDVLDTKEQARLLMHETVMSLFQMQFLGFADVCVRARLGMDCSLVDEAKIGRGHPNDPSSALPEQMRQQLIAFLKPQPRRELTAQDYASIRRVTDTLMQGQSFGKHSHFKEYMLKAGFDRRIFSEADPVTSETEGITSAAAQIPAADFPNDFTLDTIDALSLLKAASLSGHLPQHCRFDERGQAQARCNLKIGDISMKTENSKAGLGTLYRMALADIEIEELSLTDARDVRREKIRLIVLPFASGSKSEFSYSTGRPAVVFNAFVTNVGLSATNSDGSLEPFKIGQRVWTLQISLTGRKETPKIFAYSLIPMVVTSVANDQAQTQMMSPSVMPAFIAADQARLPGQPYMLGFQAASGPGPTRSSVPTMIIDLANRPAN